MFCAALTALFVIATLAHPALGGSIEDAAAAYRKGDYVTAFALLRPLADQGDARAQYNIAGMYARGEGAPSDAVEAVAWYRKSAEQGYGAAHLSLGTMYLNGRGVPRDYVEAEKWIRLAADRGMVQAQDVLGMMYEHGQGVPQNNVQALKWYNLATTRFTATPAQRAFFGNMPFIQRRDGLIVRMTPEQIDEAQRLAAEWKPVR